MNKILVMGKFTIEKDHWRVLKAIMKLEKGDDTKFTLVNKPENYILTKEEVEEYALVVTTQSNPLVLKNVKKVLGDKPLVKPYRNKNKDLTHFMLLNDIVVDYKYELFEVGNKRRHNKGKNGNKNNMRKKEFRQKENVEEKVNVEEQKSLDETPVQEKPKKRRRQ